ncbi:MAG: Glutamyl-tRNA reductase [uncultured Acidimicrobiales bacterium]|uniref:Glutamyl-tRNA reductase n=1 Tax=uncultured Acidimicrobiales bacterium TaxID=310071 RepID=A0A6J4HGY8_9ACTN|nr:MAG: Glutamyl-tRNA reductase [uncultured Acidimicrobiales bacterium]
MIVVGVNHRTVPLEVLERMTVTGDRLPKALHDLVSRDAISEAVVLSTCNRTEVYVTADRFHPAVGDVRHVLSGLADLAPEDFSDHLYTFHDAAAVAHLFSVVSGLDSAVLGESEILGQVRNAWEQAVVEGAAGSGMNMLFRHALEVGKRVRTETSIGRHTASVSQAAVELAEARLGTLAGKRVLVLGAGDMGEGMVHSLVRSGVAEVLVANRTRARADELAAAVGGRSVAVGELSGALAEVDVLLTSTGATSVMVDHGDLEPAVADRQGRPLLVIDVAVPRDVDPSAAELPGVDLLDMDDLRAFADAGLAERRKEVSTVRDLIDEEVQRYRALVTHRQAAPLIAALRERAEAARLVEVDRVSARLTEGERASLDLASRALVAKLLHEPTVRLKEAAGTARGERLADALRDLFDLD